MSDFQQAAEQFLKENAIQPLRDSQTVAPILQALIALVEAEIDLEEARKSEGETAEHIYRIANEYRLREKNLSDIIRKVMDDIKKGGKQQ